MPWSRRGDTSRSSSSPAPTDTTRSCWKSSRSRNCSCPSWSRLCWQREARSDKRPMSSDTPTSTAGRKAPTRTHERVYCMSDPLEKLTDETIVAQIPFGSRVLDLGCGDGRLLARLRDTHGASIQGIELDRRQIIGAMHHGVPAIHADLDKGLEGVPDHAFDF